MANADAVLIVGEIVVDYTVPQPGAECKLRLGGIVHAARGLWAAGMEYAVAAFCPQYLVDEARRYLAAHGCQEFIWVGDVIGAPNVIVIGDPTEVSHQGYEDLLRDYKHVKLREPAPDLQGYRKVAVFPGKFDVSALLDRFSPDAQFTFDVAYDVESLASLLPFRARTQAIILSTSSPLFAALGQDEVDDLIAEVKSLLPKVFLLKENRGGSRLFNLLDGSVENIPASLGKTVNSVGVGDVYSAVMLAFSDKGWVEAAWRGCQAATAYAQTTYPDDFQRDVRRSFALSVDALRELGGTILPWHDRPRFSIYLAGPDFSYVRKPELDRAVESLKYHNFRVRRPIQENGELARPASQGDLARTYHMDYQLLKECDAVFAIPLGRDPGTLVEIGMAIVLGKPVVTFDPRNENDNTMVMVGSSVYSADLDACLNSTFDALAKLRMQPA
ncbi:nucleoside 2-deoxyribosyltransferase [Ralstonia solanacearum]|uniref:nucleoside 2-deoxyribosyltransferase n=1 Tax=Ralstonia solanacearum TaxID=305 RepID=UPI0023065A5A|nr:nucleoside 2-deoxyribosyltransferase [Ralstonia solanacearum]MDB0567410.1 nucleoside 2-deoxyribosyltransferase [Ralstonia solanacearum]MDB0577230.1 nucleoside 2-deoxyribosyltransferase [Ralstonia solanacearum]